MKYEKRELKSLIQVDKIVTIHYFELSKDFFYPPETHNFWELHYVDKGTAISINQDQTIELNSGEVYFHKPNDKHQLRSNGIVPPNVCVISFVSQSQSLEAIENKKLKLSQDQKSIISRFLDEANANFDISHSSPEKNKLSLRKNRPLGGDQMLKIYIEEFLLSLVRELSIKKQTVNSILQIDEYNDSLINSIIAYFRENITKNLTLSEICNNFHFSKSYICKKFTDVTGKSLNEFFIDMKISTAKHLIRSKNPTLATTNQISDWLNFSSNSYFCYVFKKKTGLTPKEYAKSIRKYDK